VRCSDLMQQNDMYERVVGWVGWAAASRIRRRWGLGSMELVFVERRLELNSIGEVTVQFFRPEPDDRAYRCAYQIKWPDRERRSFGAGIDAVQALILAMCKAHVELLVSPEGRAGMLTWSGTRDLGLPLPDGFTPADFD
jgi:hypothetical protein